MLKAVLFDFGGVVAEEGFQEGLKAIGRKNGIDPDVFFTTADRLIFETGYLTGTADEAAYWDALRERTGIRGSDAELRQEIMKRFVLRPEMIAAVDRLRAKGLTVAMLSDQTNWLEEIDGETALFQHFDRVFNSYRLHKSKRDQSIFRDVGNDLGVKLEETLFIDDNGGHIRRAAEAGLRTIHFTTPEDFEKKMRRFIQQEQAFTSR